MTDPNSDKKLLAALALKIEARQIHINACGARGNVETQVLAALQAVRDQWSARREQARRVESVTDDAYKLAKTYANIALNAHEQTLMEALYDSRRKTS